MPVIIVSMMYLLPYLEIGVTFAGCCGCRKCNLSLDMIQLKPEINKNVCESVHIEVRTYQLSSRAFTPINNQRDSFTASGGMICFLQASAVSRP
jgi:hypothetical protein